MEQLLFKDSETFVKERPTKLTENQEIKIWNKLAKEVIENQWSSNDIETIVNDLKSLSMSDSGYEMAKDLEGFKAKGCYHIDTMFIEWLDMLDNEFYDAKLENVKAWIKAHDIKPKHVIGTQLIIQEKFVRDQRFQVGNIIFINGYYETEAKYCISDEKESSINTLISYELIEKNCKII